MSAKKYGGGPIKPPPNTTPDISRGILPDISPGISPGISRGTSPGIPPQGIAPQGIAQGEAQAAIPPPRRARRASGYKARLVFDLALFTGLAVLAAAVFYQASGKTSYNWQWERLAPYLARLVPEDGGHFWQRLTPGLLLRGFAVTIQISFWSFLLASLFGFILGLCRFCRRPFGRLFGGTCVTLLRNVPPLILVFIIHYFINAQVAYSIDWGWVSLLPPLFPVPSQMPVFTSAVLALGLYEGAYVAEIVRAGLESVPKTQWEAGLALGLSSRACLFKIVLPQARRMMLPPLVSQTVSLVKDSSIVSIIAVQELTQEGMDVITASGLVFEVWLTVTALYLLLCLAISGVGRLLARNRN